MSSRWTRLRTKITRYAAFVRQVAVDGLWRYRRRVLIAWITGGMSVGLQIVALTVALKYARYFGDDETITLAGISIRVRESPWLLGACGVLVLVALLIAAAAVYISKRQALIVWREYARLCTMRALSILGGGAAAARLGPEAPDDSRLMLHLRNECLLAGRVLMLLVGLATPSVQLLVATVALLWLEPFLTMILMGMAAAAAVFLFRVNVGATNQSLLMEKLSPAASQEYRRILQRHRWTAATSDASLIEQDHEIIDGTIGQYNRAYLGRYEMINRSDFIGAMLMALAVCLMLLVLGGGIMREGLGWQRLVLYLVALRYAMTSFRDVANRLTGVNLFYGQVRRYYRFIEEAAAVERPALPPREYEVSLDQPLIEGSLTRLSIAPGGRLALLGPLEVNRYTLAFVLGRVLGHTAPPWRAAVASARFVSSRAVLNGRTLRAALGVSGPERDQELKSMLEAAGLESSGEGLRGMLDQPVDESSWSAVEPRVRSALMIWAVLVSDAKWIVIDAETLTMLPAKAIEYALARLGDRFVLIEHRATVERIGRFGEQCVFVLDHARLAGMGDPAWAAAHRAQIETLVRKSIPAWAGGGTRDDMLDFDLEE